MLASFLGGRVFGEAPETGLPGCLALHGWERSRHDFAAFARLVPTLALDLPGFGASPPPEEPWGSADYARLLAPLLADLPRPHIVVGHSFGGRVAVALAAGYPDAVDHLVLTGVPLLRLDPAPRPLLRFRIARALAARHLLAESTLERMRQRHGSADYRAASGVLRGILVRAVAESYEAPLRQLAERLHLVWGAGDQTVALAVAERVHELVPGSELVVCPGSGHDLGPELTAALADCVTALRRGGATVP
ncbi:MAG: alpha/beta fold hydrolase [Mycobacteriales bacterium]